MTPVVFHELLNFFFSLKAVVERKLKHFFNFPNGIIKIDGKTLCDDGVARILLRRKT